jgi:hypothetical protein
MTENWKSIDFDSNYVKEKFLYFKKGDSYENYIENGNKSYTENAVVYEQNENYFRISSEHKKNKIDEEKTIACFGCSCTYGIGLPWEETWPYILNSRLGEDWSVMNYGVVGASMDKIARLIHNYTLKHKPKAICCWFPEIARMELFDSFGITDYIWDDDLHYTKPLYFEYKKIANHNYQINSFIKNYVFIKNICDLNGIDFYWWSWDGEILELQNQFDFQKFFNYENFIYDIKLNAYLLNALPRARDGLHYGKIPCQILANSFYQKIKNNKNISIKYKKCFFILKNSLKYLKLKINPASEKINKIVEKRTNRFIY